MNGPHDMGGMTGFGAIDPEAGEPVFHAEWERRTFALTLAMSATGSWYSNRPARESLEALKYWSSSYYEIWLEALIKVMIEQGLVSESEIAAGHMRFPPKPVRRVLAAAMVASMLATGGPENRPSAGKQRFAIGDKVRARNITPVGHTRLPRYARGRTGEIVIVHGTHVFPDSSAHGKGDDPQWLYTVKFAAHELWGHDNRDSVCIDLWEPYLEPS